MIYVGNLLKICFQNQLLKVLYEKKVFLKISQNLQGNTCARVAFLIKLQNLVADIIFGITQKLLYITLSNLVR